MSRGILGLFQTFCGDILGSPCSDGKRDYERAKFSNLLSINDLGVEFSLLLIQEAGFERVDVRESGNPILDPHKSALHNASPYQLSTECERLTQSPAEAERDIR